MSYATSIKTEHKFKFPSTYHIIFFDDDTTPIESVIKIISNVFNRSEDDAFDLTMEIHENGKAIVKDGLSLLEATELVDECFVCGKTLGVYGMTIVTEQSL